MPRGAVQTSGARSGRATGLDERAEDGRVQHRAHHDAHGEQPPVVASGAAQARHREGADQRDRHGGQGESDIQTRAAAQQLCEQPPPSIAATASKEAREKGLSTARRRKVMPQLSTA